MPSQKKRLNIDEMIKQAKLSVATINCSSVVCFCYKSKDSKYN